MTDKTDKLVSGLWRAFYFRDPSILERENANSQIARIGLERLVENLIDSELHREYAANVGYPPGHFYSALFDVKDTDDLIKQISHDESDVFHRINLSTAGMDELWSDISPFFENCPKWEDNHSERLRYHFSNGSYPFTDAMTFSSIVRKLKPNKIIEVGAGYSTAVLLDTIDHDENIKDLDLTLVQPFPHTIERVLWNEDWDRFNLIERKVQDVELVEFEKLSGGDILFIDSTHVAKTGSDVVFEIIEILPRLAKGVWVHFHDIFYPFEYPVGWIKNASRSWNEIYFLRAFLIDNPTFRVRLFNNYFVNRRLTDDAYKADRFRRNPGGAIWLEKVA